jgi:glycosyltransferase involved in cell wall biosynthesis
MKICIVTDAWHPQINGVVRTLNTTVMELKKLGHQVTVIGPDQFKTYPLPTYKEIRIALFPGAALALKLDALDPDCIHISTEGPLGLAARNYCVKRRLRFTTSYHTRFPEYIAERIPVPAALIYPMVRWFHRPASAVMIATASIERELAVKGFQRMVRWSRGVDTELFHPRQENFLDLPRPIMLYVGRVAIEKNIEAFLDLDLPGSKLIVGGGPQFESISRKYPNAHFVGPKHGEDLARYYAVADVFVFPSLTDTFGLVLLEALASGTPVAAFPVAGPLDVIGDAPVGCLNNNLHFAITEALKIPRSECVTFAQGYSWHAATQQFLSHLKPVKQMLQAMEQAA